MRTAAAAAAATAATAARVQSGRAAPAAAASTAAAAVPTAPPASTAAATAPGVRATREGLPAHPLPRRGAPKLPPPRTPDGRYIVVRGRVWRTINPHLPPATAAALRRELGKARAGVKAATAAGDADAVAAARRRVDAAKRGLGERGPPWWVGKEGGEGEGDDARDWNRYMVWNTPYAEWWAAAEGEGLVAAGASGGDTNARAMAAAVADPADATDVGASKSRKHEHLSG
ncbi:hypothetical protein MMPV_008251 [Pyropia vietnamensis]